MHLQHHRRTGLELLANKSTRLGDCQMDTCVIDSGNRRNSPRQLTLEAALIIDLLDELAGPEFLVFEQLKTNKTALR